jgi:hypothetical protein
MFASPSINYAGITLIIITTVPVRGQLQ